MQVIQNIIHINIILASYFILFFTSYFVLLSTYIYICGHIRLYIYIYTNMYALVLTGGGIVNINKSRAISTTRTVFRLNTNQNHAYEDYLLMYNNTLLYYKH